MSVPYHTETYSGRWGHKQPWPRANHHNIESLQECHSMSVNEGKQLTKMAVVPEGSGLLSCWESVQERMIGRDGALVHKRGAGATWVREYG
jgi:hypothetical protein